MTAAVEAYFSDLGRIRGTGGATGELSYHPALRNLLNAVGAALKPKVFCVGELADQGVGRPDFGLYAAKQIQKGRPREGQLPERGAVEVKPAEDDAWLTAESAQVSRYRGRYGLVMATNLRDFVLLGRGRGGPPGEARNFRLAGSAEEFWRRIGTPRAFARDVGAGLGEYLARALSHRAALAEPKDLAWLLASYARDGLARVEAGGRRALAGGGACGAGGGARRPLRGRQGRALLPFDAGADPVLRGRVASITGQARSTLTRENGQPTDSNLAQPSSVILLRARTPICASVF